jgi:branched-chain amino acid transport system ATP-binding protein
MAEPLLRLDAVSAGYGGARVLHEVSLDVAEGEAVALLGRNGVGKTTLIATAIGATRLFGGRIAIGGRDATRLPPEARAALGLGWVPQERNIFRSLTVEENLTAVARPGPWDVRRVQALFPRLAERRRNLGSELSGGEQQMLAMARADAEPAAAAGRAAGGGWRPSSCRCCRRRSTSTPIRTSMASSPTSATPTTPR